MLPISITVAPRKTLIAQSINGSALTLVEDHENLVGRFGSISASANPLVTNEVNQFGNIFVYVHSLGSAAYRIEWQSKMTGASVSIAKIARSKYTVIRKWAASKDLNDISSAFDSRKAALLHFFSNVDVIKTSQSILADAKSKVLELFTKLEGIAPVKPRVFPRIRLQGAIGRKVVVKNKAIGGNKPRPIAEGILMQIVGTEAEVKIEKRIELGPDKAKKDILKFHMNQVYLM